jgi:hypothetical protein
VLALITSITLLLIFWLVPLHVDGIEAAPSYSFPQSPFAKIQTTYYSEKDRTTVRLTPVLIASGVGKYHSIHMSPHFSFPGRSAVTPEIIDFELQTVVKGRLRTDLYVVFVIDGEKVFLSSNRWAVKRPVPGRVWMGERLVFRMPYATFVKITKANTLAVMFDGVNIPVGENEKQALRELLSSMSSAGN